VSRENVEIVRRGYEQFRATGEVQRDLVTPDFVWDMSTFRGWPEQQTYEGADGAREFLTAWTGAWEDWTLEVESLEDAGTKVVAVLRQTGTSKATGLAVDMRFAQVWTLREGLQARMEMYADPDEGLKAAGLA